MDPAHRLHDLLAGKGVSLRGGLVSFRHSALLQRLQRPLRALILASASAALGVTASDLSRSQGVESWLRAHAPGEELWERIAEARGFRRMDSDDSRHLALRGLPDRGLAHAAIWVSADGRWLVRGRPSGQTPWVGRRGSEKKPKAPKDWKPLGESWQGVEAFARFALGREDSAPGPKRSKEPVWRDPREIRF